LFPASPGKVHAGFLPYQLSNLAREVKSHDKT